ncbi:MAG: D-alanyl-D-alanine carboxypeptidase [Firmicutes bacterium]|nr:D-alanyl-D-alanine carboxypeptidase [Bacillota bacterium]
MKRFGCLFLLLGLLFLPSSVAGATVLLEGEPPVEVNAEAALLMEVESGTRIWEAASHKKLYPASITKIMSLLLVMEQLEEGKISLHDQVTVSARASAVGGTELFLSEGDQLSLEELLTGMAVGSANDAAVAVAEHVAGSQEAFVELMNKRARQLGLTATHYCNPHGLHHPEHYTTAADVAKVSCALLEHPRIHRYLTIWMDEHYLEGKIKAGEVFLSNTNRLVMFYPGCDGLKTGYTREAGNGIAATARRGDSRFLAVVLNAPTVEERYEAAVNLLDYGFNHYKSVPVMEKGEIVAVLPVDKGSPPQVKIIPRAQLSLFMERGEPEEFEQEILLPERLTAPVEEGQVVGEIVVSHGERGETRLDLVTGEPVSRCSLFTFFQRLLCSWWRFGR